MLLITGAAGASGRLIVKHSASRDHLRAIRPESPGDVQRLDLKQFDRVARMPVIADMGHAAASEPQQHKIDGGAGSPAGSKGAGGQRLSWLADHTRPHPAPACRRSRLIVEWGLEIDTGSRRWSGP
jgi:hypothetical protein